MIRLNKTLRNTLIILAAFGLLTWHFQGLNFFQNFRQLQKNLEINQAQAATSGKMVLYMHKEPSDKNETLNSLSLTPPEPAANTATSNASTTNVNATPPTATCESSTNTGETFNQLEASGNSTGNHCMATFISPPVGAAFTIGATEASAVAANIWFSKSTTSITVVPNIYIYKWDGTTLTRIKTFTGSNPGGTTVTQANFALTATDNVSSIPVAATDRIVAIVSLNETATGGGGANVSFYFDSSANNPPSSITLKYTMTTPTPPTLTGAKDDDFNTAAATTACSSGGVAYNTKWTCISGTAANAAGAFNAEDATAAGSGDTSGWLWLRSQFTASGTPSNFGATPSNTFLYQTTDSGYGNGVVQTVVNGSMAFTIGATNPASPFSHSGLVLWSSNTDYLELQAYSDAAKGSINTAKVALVSNSGGTVTFIATASINSTLSNGLYNRIWLKFTNTSGSYQAAYSTDGSTFTNLGAAQAHANFARVGLNAYNGISALASAYSGAFEWFNYTFAVPSTPISGTVQSSPIDTTATAPAYNSIMWTGTSGTGKVRFQIASAPAATGPFSFVGGPTCSAADWYDPGAPSTPSDLGVCANSQSINGNRYFEYKIQLCSNSDCATNGLTSPDVTGVYISWSP